MGHLSVSIAPSTLIMAKKSYEPFTALPPQESWMRIAITKEESLKATEVAIRESIY